VVIPFVSMDAIFSLAAVPRARVLERAAARVPGCLYLCLWAPVTAQPSSRFVRTSLSRSFGYHRSYSVAHCVFQPFVLLGRVDRRRRR
jgi:hypothetical protein